MSLSSSTSASSVGLAAANSCVALRRRAARGACSRASPAPGRIGPHRRARRCDVASGARSRARAALAAAADSAGGRRCFGSRGASARCRLAGASGTLEHRGRLGLGRPLLVGRGHAHVRACRLTRIAGPRDRHLHWLGLDVVVRLRRRRIAFRCAQRLRAAHRGQRVELAHDQDRIDRRAHLRQRALAGCCGR